MMRRVLILSALLLGLAPALRADAPSQAQTQSLVLAVTGKSSYRESGKTVEHPVVQGLRLDRGVTLRTGYGASLKLKLPDGSTMGMAQNSSITLGSQSPKDKHPGAMKLLSGLVRWVIQQADPAAARGGDYEIYTDNAVAAVKGTDFSAQSDGGNLDVKVYSSQHEGVVVGDSSGANAALAAPGQEVLRQADGGLLGRSLSKDDYADLGKTWQDLPPVKPPAGLPDHAPGFQPAPKLPPPSGKGPGGAPAPSPAGTAAPTAAAGSTPAPAPGAGGTPAPTPAGGPAGPGPAPAPAPTPDDVVQGIKDQVQDLRQDLGVCKTLDAQTKSHDLYSGAAFIDRNGYRVQVASLILPNQAANVVDKVITSKRSDGPDTGLSIFSDRYTYNQALPADWTTVVGQPLNAPANLATGAPAYYLQQQDVTLLSPAGCAACLSTVYTGPGGSAAPVKELNGAWEQSYTNYYTIAGQQLAQASWAPNASGLGFTQTGGNLINVQPTQRTDGSWSFAYSYNVTGTPTYNPLFTANVWILDGNGGTLTGLLGSPGSLSGLQLLDSSTIAELQLTSPLFPNGGDVDVLLEEPDLAAAFP
ncbi:MAG TPA: FecR family protein [bacterium]|jgi:hypothetical protein|nr:FecR family protein [bacterium]